MTDQITSLPPIPPRVPVDNSIASLRNRLVYARRTLGVSLEDIAMVAGLSEKALRDFEDPDWNPVLRTIRQTDQLLADQLRQWRKSRERDPKAPPLRVTRAAG